MAMYNTFNSPFCAEVSSDLTTLSWGSPFSEIWYLSKPFLRHHFHLKLIYSKSACPIYYNCNLTLYLRTFTNLIGADIERLHKTFHIVNYTLCMWDSMRVSLAGANI